MEELSWQQQSKRPQSAYAKAATALRGKTVKLILTEEEVDKTVLCHSLTIEEVRKIIGGTHDRYFAEEKYGWKDGELIESNLTF